MSSEQADAGVATAGPTVFLSYARGDQPFAQKLIDALGRQGFSVWWDGLISGGHEFSEKIEKALASADAIVVLWSEESAHSHWVRDEAGFARDHQRMVPVTIDGSDAPLGFRQIHRINLQHWHGNDAAPEFLQLCQSIRAVAGSGDAAVAPSSTRATGISRRQAMLAGGAVAAIAGLGGLYWLTTGGQAEAASIAVLPFRNLSGDAAEDYFSDGLAEELRSTLSQAEQLSVAAQTSSDKFKDGEADAKTMAKALGVTYLVEGSVRRAADLVRVSTRIVEGKTGLDRWSQSFDREAADSLAVQSDIAAFVTDALLAGIDKAQRPSERIGGTRKTDAFEAFLRGAALYRQASSDDSDAEALRQFDKAISIDPNYAAAQAAKSRVLTAIANTAADRAQSAANYAQAIKAAESAIRLAPDMAEGHSALGFALFNGKLDARAAASPYQRSYELGFGNADILSAFANFAGRTGKFDGGREAIARAKRLDPLNPTVFRNAALLEYAARDFDAAEAQYRTALTMNDKARAINAGLGFIAYLRGDMAAARQFFDREPDTVTRLLGIALVENKQGNASAALAAQQQLARTGGESIHYELAQLFAQQGQADQAIDNLQKAYALRDAGLVRLRNDPLLDPIRKDSRFTELARTIGFE